MIDQFKIFADNNINLELTKRYPDQYRTVLNNRNNREITSKYNFVLGFYPTPPYPELKSLILIKSSLENEKNLTTDPIKLADINQKLSQIQSFIDSGQYADPENEHWIYRQQWLAKAAEFVWPSVEEQATRAQEEQDLLNLLS